MVQPPTGVKAERQICVCAGCLRARKIPYPQDSSSSGLPVPSDGAALSQPPPPRYAGDGATASPPILHLLRTPRVAGSALARRPCSGSSPALGAFHILQLVASNTFQKSARVALFSCLKTSCLSRKWHFNTWMQSGGEEGMTDTHYSSDGPWK